jgi:hypothetical protein
VNVAGATTRFTLNDPVTQTLTVATVQGDDTQAVQITERIAEAAGGGVVEFGPYSYKLWQPEFFNGSAYTYAISGAVNNVPPARAGLLARMFFKMNAMSRVPESLPNSDIVFSISSSSSVIPNRSSNSSSPTKRLSSFFFVASVPRNIHSSVPTDYQMVGLCYKQVKRGFVVVDPSG